MFGYAGAVDAQVVAVAVLIGGVAFPGAFLAKALVERLPVRLHTAMLDAVVLIGGGVMVVNAFLAVSGRSVAADEHRGAQLCGWNGPQQGGHRRRKSDSRFVLACRTMTSIGYGSGLARRGWFRKPV